MTAKKNDRAIKVPVKQRSASFTLPLQYKVVSDEEITLTKDRAFEFLELKDFQGERPVRQSHVQFLFDEWASGRMMWDHVILASCHLNGDTYRINGQHTCWMRANIPPEKEPVHAKVRHITYRVETEDQLRALYSTFDRNATRSAGHISKVLLINGRAARDLPVSSLNRLVAGFRVYFAEDTVHMNRVMSVDELTAMIENNFAEQFNIVGHFYKLHVEEWSVYLKRAAIIGALFATFEKNVQESDKFWSAVVSGVGLESKTDPRWQLRRYIETHGHSTIGGDEVVSKEQLFCTCLLAWNHYRKGEAVTNLRTMDTRQKVRA